LSAPNDTCNQQVLPEELEPLLESGTPNLPSDQALQDYGKSGYQALSVSDFAILKKAPDSLSETLNGYLNSLDSQITSLVNTYAELGVSLPISEDLPSSLEELEAQAAQHVENITALSGDLTTAAILDAGAEYIHLLSLYRQLLRDVLSANPVLLPVNTASSSSTHVLRKLGKSLEHSWAKIQRQHSQTSQQVNALLQALNIAAADYTEAYHDNITQSLQQSIAEAEAVLNNLEAQLLAESGSFSVQANTGKAKQRQTLLDQIKQVKETLQTLRDLSTDTVTAVGSIVEASQRQLRQQMEQLQNLAQKYGPEAVQQVEQFYAQLDPALEWLPHWQVSKQIRGQVLMFAGKACLKPENPPDCVRNTPLGVYEDASYHGPKDTPRKSKRPKDGQAALANSIPDPSGGTVRVGISQNEFVVLSRTQEANPSIGRPALYHGHVRDWKGLDDWMKNELSRTGMVKVQKKGKDVTIIKDNC
jgi:hypothetical protein